MSANPPELDQALRIFSAGQRPQAVTMIEGLVARGMPQAMLLLGHMKWGGHIAQDPVGARRLYERAGSAGSHDGAVAATNLLASGIAGERNWLAALERLKSEAASDPARKAALDLLGAMELDASGNPQSLPDGDVLSDSPQVTLYRGVFSPAECAYVLKIAEPGYQPSMVYNAQRQLVRDPIRSSDGSVLHWLIEDPAIHALNRRLASLAGLPPENGEAAQVLRYNPGQEYKPHHDFVRAAENQRTMTALVWLNDGYDGGETAFLRTGLKVKGRKGDAVVFRNTQPDSSLDPMSEHAGMPVKRGTKLLYNRWIREARWQP
ncbi:2OG-Fe(II) oxygenase [Novosphingobium sp. TH158]|uniref:prolyl hydroxylase family protein n=1 Tax=Novosphingobium sp. TH158 TaxID=2067455 RepID=UPI000C7A411C|nr:2OG-Fe(II) oxygenase [Novosphingobium sp. TH158]PLK26129.1 peptidyl prolyl 4-hydroxylase subunit alpha [Novosphingobium sp. TH158]